MSDTKKNSVLIVDDSQFNITVLTQILTSEYITYVAKNGKEALVAAKNFLPDVILLDIVMSGMNGFEVITELKSMAETCEIPIIFITALDNREDEERGLSLNAADYIGKPFSPAIVKLRVRNQVQIVNQIRAIKHLSMFDTLTEIPNRRSFNDRLHVEWERAIREKINIGMLMMDVDKFKRYNDTYGHMQGDILLQKAAQNFEQTLRCSSGFVARWGGEEFAVLLPNSDKEYAMEIAEKIRDNIAKMAVLCGSLQTSATISIGANDIVPKKNSSIDTFISQADFALYEAKEQGRNRVCFYDK